MKGTWVETFVKIDKCWNCRQHRYILDQFVQKCFRPLKKVFAAKPPVADRFSWLVHNAQSGVPYGREGTWFHFRFRLATSEKGFPTATMDQLQRILGRKFEMTRVVEEGSMDEIAGVDLRLFKGGADGAWDTICAQAAWTFTFLDEQKYVANPQVCRQFLHYFANMLQQAAS